MNSSEKAKKGFTLIEILVVVVIIGLLASLVAPKLFSKLSSSKQKTVKAQIRMIETALDAFKIDVGRYPTESEGLKVLWENPNNIKGWDGPYLPKPVKSDPWGNPYIYKVPGDNGRPFELKSLGADGKEGGDGENKDISVWDTE
ncbi:MAG TPA: type II secretion system protein GspG [Persephonella sp.]|nr:type II secretion system protein GspG [Hydrogenothermaceae bacterium]HIQ25643.1 type II secretion system protein GspG [Persephonella sp.]